MAFKPVNPRQSFPELEKEIMAFWKENNTFQKSIDTRANSEEFNFYDGPPFATWTPHYGHILAWTIKDIVPRYQTMLGKKVERRFGWDCHWLPIEWIVEKKLWIKSKKEIDENIWVFKFNEECRANVLTYTDEWRKSVERMWRWVDMDNDYKTMDVEFMESVWWVFKELYDKWLIYEDYRVVPYSVWMSTPLSNFEVNQWYKDKQDKTITVKFKVEWNASKYILAWTTTPWTLVSNLWLAVWENVEYSEILDKKTWETYVLATSRIWSYYKNEEDYSLVRSYPGSCLAWIKYEPLYPDFVTASETNSLPIGQKLGKNAYSVVIGHHVTDDSWTWIVHIAPAYWEDDSLIWKEKELGFVAHIDDNGYTYNLLENNWVWVFDFNELAIENMKKAWLSVKIDTIVHSYPHCWRTDVPLIYRAISAWYVNIDKIKDKMIAANQNINWVPDTIKNWRFGKWLEWARDWNISRNRYWWSAIPVWQSEDKKHEWCIGSIEELYELNKDFNQIEKKDNKYFYTSTWKEIDLHKHFVDDIKIKHPTSWVELSRIPEVLDCWFESGSMPYASKHYPFENKENFKFPADFIAEWLDQTRGWFYTLVVLSAALFDKNPFNNVIVNWIILAEDGKKMAKSLKNYTDPNILMDKFGADAMRFYLVNSPAVEAQDLRFSDAWVEEVVKKVILPLWNTYSFFTTYANIDKYEAKKWNIYYVRHGQTDNNLNWIVNGWDDDMCLNENGIAQAHDLWNKMKNLWEKFDVIITTSLSRAQKTASILKSYLNYDVETIIDDRFDEQHFGEYKWMTFDELREKFNTKNDRDLTRLYRNNTKENLENFEKRVISAYKEIEEKYAGKNVLIVAHGWTFRPINKYLNNLDDEIAYYWVSGAKNARLLKLPNYVKENNLDKWIISETNKLVYDVTKALDNYKLNDAWKPIVKFMDNLTNWYVRRSRKRFWAEWLTSDKLQAYNTLYEVLVEITKIIAPYMPFVSENIFKNLTWKESVHLELFPEVIKSFIFKDLSENMAETQEIITLWLAGRANSKIRVRQPLNYVKIPHLLDEYYNEILKEELNVKEVIVFDENELPKKICKPNARLIGPKFGQNVKFIISEAKAWNFEELENWNVLVWEFELEVWEFEIEFIWNESSKNESEALESGNWLVVAIDKTITENLKLEWYARDIVRQIQESRKEADYKVDDRINIEIIVENEEISKAKNEFESYIENETLSKFAQNLSNPDLEKNIEIEWQSLTLKLKK